MWSFMWSKPLLCHFQQPEEIQQTQVPQCFAAFLLDPSRIQPRHSQTRRDTNFAIPGYSISTIISRRGRKSKIFLSVVIPVVKAAFVPLSAIVENPLSPALQGFAVFRSDPSRIPPRHTPITCHANWATPEYNYIIPWADQKKQEKSVCPHWGHTDFDDVGPPPDFG